jgi:hypothetical protein
MLKFIENLRGAPEETKKSFAVVVSVFITFIIVGFTLAVSNPLSVTAKKNDTKTVEEKLPSPFSVMASQIGASFNGLKNDLAPLKEMISVVKEEMKATTTPTVATSTIKITPTVATTTKTVSKPAPTVKKKVEPSPAKYGPFLIPGVKVNKANMGAMAVMTIGKDVVAVRQSSLQAHSINSGQATSTDSTNSTSSEQPLRPDSGQETATSTYN